MAEVAPKLFPDDDYSEPIEPFLRWPGGKRRLVAVLRQATPSDVRKRIYHEPFLGGGALFLALQPSLSYLSDANPHLMACYKSIRDNPDQVAAYLTQHLESTSEAYYYGVRDLYNRTGNSAAQAARFIYLNKTCFNGIFRVNRKGEFNVPYGWKEPPWLPSREDLRRVSKALKNASLTTASFDDTLESLGVNDFVYLDPPYPPLNGTSYFTHYTTDRFGEIDQCRLATCVAELHERGAKFLMSNADTPLIRDLYSRFRILRLSVTRYITCRSTKHKVNEVLITNYPVTPQML
jgi:DNA adenine methylase